MAANLSINIPTSQFDIYELVSTAAGKWLGPIGSQLSDVKPGPGVPVAEYILPDQSTISNLQVLFNVLNKSLDVTDDIVLFANELEIAMVRSLEDHHLVFFRPNNFKKVHISFLWRFGTADDLIIEDVHEMMDGVEFSSPCIFLNTRARCMLINAIHPRSIQKPANTPSITDGAHTPSTLYYLAHCMLANLYPNSFFVQLHGHSFYPPGDAIIMYNNCGKFVAKKSACRMLCDELQKHFTLAECNTFTLTSNLPGVSTIYNIPLTGLRDDPVTNCVFAWSSHGVDTIIEGRQLNGGNVNHVGTDSGRFVMVEFDKRFKDKSLFLENCVKFSKSLNGVASIW